jgi:hypothetical protein
MSGLPHPHTPPMSVAVVANYPPSFSFVLVCFFGFLTMYRAILFGLTLSKLIMFKKKKKKLIIDVWRERFDNRKYLKKLFD